MPTEVQAGKPRIDMSRYELTVDGRRIKLERQPMDLLIFLAERRGGLVTREEIIGRLWGEDVFVDVDRSINAAVRKIRSALKDDPSAPKYVETVIGKGYRLIGDVEIVGAQPASQSISLTAAGPEIRAAAMGRSVLALGLVLVAAIVAVVWTNLRWQRQNSAEPHIHSIAVLPLANLSGDASQDYFADGMTDELITEMAQIGSLRVISRSSVMHYKGTSKTIPEIARELRVDGVVEGSVVHSGNRVRITAQLIQAPADKHLWASSYEGEARDVLGMQDAVARDVAKQIRLRLTSEQQARLSRPRPVNAQAHEAYLKGLYHWNKRDRVDLERAIEYFNQAIAIDPEYALPYAGLAEAYVPLVYSGQIRGSEFGPKVAALASKALQLDPSLAEAHTALGAAKSFFEHDWPGSVNEFERAIALNPNYATAHAWYSQTLASMNRTEEAVAEDNRALELDPLSLIINSHWGHRLYRVRRYPEALAALNAALELDQNFPATHWELGSIYAEQKNFPAALAELQKANELFHGHAIVLGEIGYVYGAAGQGAHARQVLQQLRQRASQQYVDPYSFALVYLGLGNKDQALLWLQKAYDDRDCWITFITAEPMLDPLRSDPRFVRLIQQMRLP